MNLEFKFRTDASTDQRNQVLSKLTEYGAKVEQVFPDEIDPDLAALYTVEVVDDSGCTALMRRLKRSPAIDYVEPQAVRTLQGDEQA